MELHLGNMTAPSRDMSRYEFTTRQGYHVCTVEARTAIEAREKAVGLSGQTDLICTHLSDYHPFP